MTWVLQDSEIDALELSDELTLFARQMAGESSVQLTSDREGILRSAALEVELYAERLFFRGVGATARVTTSVFEVNGPGDVPIVGAMPRSVGVSITSVEKWSDSREDFEPVDYVRRPTSEIRVADGGAYRIVASVLPVSTYPIVVNEAVARLFSFRESWKPRRNTSELADGNAPSITGAMMRSGAAECLRFIRVPAI